MQIRLKAKKEVAVTAAVQKYLDTRLRSIEKLLGAHAELARCEVELGRASGKKHQSDHMWFAEVHVKAPGGISAYAKNHAASVNAAIDDVKEEVGRQLRTAKKVRVTKRKKQGREVKRALRG